ncbi:MAG: uracil-DNA glycosylase [Treponema sp.]
MNAETAEILYRFFRTASDYLHNCRSNMPYPESFYDNEKESEPEYAYLSSPAETPVSAECERLAERGVTLSTPQDSMQPYTALAAVYQAVDACRNCRLAETRTNPVAGEGPEELSHLSNSVEVMVIGEGPGADEDAQGRPFVGRAGQLLDKMLESIGLSRKTNCYITNVVKCRPPHNRDPAPDERNCCACFLDAQIALTNPDILLVMGRIAAQHLLQTADGIGKLHGRFFEYKGIPLMPTYHPSALLRNETLKRPAWEDLKRFRAKLHELRGKG